MDSGPENQQQGTNGEPPRHSCSAESRGEKKQFVSRNRQEANWVDITELLEKPAGPAMPSRVTTCGPAGRGKCRPGFRAAAERISASGGPLVTVGALGIKIAGKAGGLSDKRNSLAVDIGSLL